MLVPQSVKACPLSALRGRKRDQQASAATQTGPTFQNKRPDEGVVYQVAAHNGDDGSDVARPIGSSKGRRLI